MVVPKLIVPNHPKCFKCDSPLVESYIDLDVFIREKKVGTMDKILVLACTNCEVDGLVLEMSVTAEGIFIGRGEDEDGSI